MKKEIEERLEEHAGVIGEKLEKLLLPLLDKQNDSEPEAYRRAQRFREYSVEVTARMVDALDRKRDLAESRILVLENGTGVMSHRLAAGDTDVVGATPNQGTADLARRINSFPSIIYRPLFQPLVVESFDLVMDSGLLAFYPRRLLEPLVQHLASLCRRKMVLEFRVQTPFFERFFSQRSTLDDSDLHLAPTVMAEPEIVNLIEAGCGMIITERRVDAGRMLIKALRKPHSRQAYFSPLK